MNNDNIYTILWLSDIHFMKYYFVDENFANRLKPELEEFLESFFNKINELITGTNNTIYNVKYIVLSGDIAYSGNEEEYYKFEEYVLDKLVACFDAPPKIIMVPGNHSINWLNNIKGTEFFKKFLKLLVNKNANRKEFIKNNSHSFNQLFSHYNRFFEMYRENSVVSNYSYHYRNKSDETIFVGLNSAWYALGIGFNNVLIDFLKKDTNLKYTYNNKYKKKDREREYSDLTDDEKQKFKLKILLEYKQDLIEYGNQITGFEMEPEIKDLLETYPDYSVFVIQHHGINWLNGKEYNYNEGSHYRKLLEQSNCLLIGHEHLSEAVAKEISMPCNTHLLRAGCFIDEELKLDNNWMSLLVVNPVTKKMFQSTLTYQRTKKEWVYKEDNDNPYLLNQKVGIYILNENREKRAIELFMKQFDIPKLENYAKLRFAPIEELEIKLIKKQREFYLYSASSKVNEFIIQVRSDIFFDKIDIVKLKAEILNNKKSKSSFTIRIVMLDLITKNGKEFYKNSNEFKRGQIMQNIANYTEINFDKFRKRFFDQFKNETDLIPFAESRFVLHIIPYWVFERHFS